MQKRTLIAALALSLALPVTSFAQAQASPPKAPDASCAKVKLTTSMGPIVIELDKAKAPISTENFVKYVESGFYNGTIFHRVIDNFMIQGGGFDKDQHQKPPMAPIKNESTNGLKNDNYTVAMARTGIRDSATSQFFVNVKDNDFLNYSGEAPQGWGYAVFGKVVDGKETVDKIKKVAVAPGQASTHVPQEPVVIQKAECVAGK
jgi:peptidyl-prolyl cis-trans isomerase B (cyclophilin B)